MAALGLSDEEYGRLLLANQYEILSRLAPDEADWGQVLDRVVRGFPLDGVPHLDAIRDYIRDPLTDADVRLIHGALDLYARLQQALDGEADEAAANFPGFDGNNEGGALSYMRILRKSDRWTYVKPEGDQAINSHHPTYEMYQRQIHAWDQLGRPNELTADQARGILGL